MVAACSAVNEKSSCASTAAPKAARLAAAQLDESFQIEAWGEDAEQAERRAALAGEIAAAARFKSLLRG